MSNNTKIAMLKASIVPEEILVELVRLGVTIPEDLSPEANKSRALSDIREAVEIDKEIPAIRETDLDALKNYSANCKEGRLYFSTPDYSRGSGRKTTFVNITYAITADGLYLIPWTDEDTFGLMLDEDTCLKPAKEPKVQFSNVTELYYGEQKAFMLCVPMGTAQES